jgi:Fur family zinc uptake transcriptional regulator
MSETPRTAPADLTRNQTLVLDALSHSRGPLSAYDILDQLRADGLRAPLQVYRALDKLVERGLAHRLESLNAFVACAHSHVHRKGIITFAICEDCGLVNEFTDAAIEERVVRWAQDNSFKVERTTMEIRGKCADCAAAA